MRYWLSNGAAGWVVLSLVWGVASIVYDVLILAVGGGVRDTISWQTQELAIANPVIPMGVGLVVGGLAVHFFVVRQREWFATGQPWPYYLLGFVAGAVLIAFTWRQRG